MFYNPAGFLLGRALGGVAASSWVPMSVLYSSYYKPEYATRSIAMINLASQSGRLVGFFIAGLFAANFGTRSVFMLSAIGGLLGFITSLFIHEDISAEKKKAVPVRELIAVGRERNLIIVTILCVFVQVITFATFSSFTVNHAVSLGASPTQLSNMHVALILPSIILNYCLSKYILEHLDAKYLIVMGFIVTALYCALVPFTASITQLYIAQAFGGIGYTLTFSLLMGLGVQNIAAEKRGAAMGFLQSIYGIGMTAGPLVMGSLTDHAGLSFGFFFMAGIAAVSTLTAAILLRRSRV
jgi:predicted MFS family arabinose efflux permease